MYHLVSTINRLLLWDCDERTYRYYIETSTDQKKWVRVADKTSEECRYKKRDKINAVKPNA